MKVLSGVNPRRTRVKHSSTDVCLVNPRWTNIILYGMNVDRGPRPWKAKANKEKKCVCKIVVFTYKQTV
jgi:hypothetical protein